MDRKLKKIGIIVLILFVTIGLTACKSSEVNKIDIGGKFAGDKPMSVMAVRIMLDKDIFYLDDELLIKLGFGFRNEQSVQSFIESGAVVVLKIEATGFGITDESDVESSDIYQKEFLEYSGSKFVCKLVKKRYIPNYYEVFEIKPILDMESYFGTIIVNATLDYKDGGYDGKNERLYYAINSEKIVFSVISLEDAQKKLK